MTRRMASFSGPAVAAVVILAGARPSPAQQVVKLGEGETLTISGFINATLFNDRGLFSSFGQGQNAEIAAAPANQPGVNQGIFDGDVRNTRINFTFNAPPVLGKWAPRATIEADFFGAFNGVPPFGDEQMRRVEVCDTCRGYLKGVTTVRPLVARAILLDDLMTVHLDVAALERGYKRPERPGYALEARLRAFGTRKDGA